MTAASAIPPSKERPMHPQLQELADQFTAARERLHRLAAAVPAEGWTRRPAPDSWSPAECVAHLNLTSRTFIPQLRDAIREARGLGGAAPARYRLGVIGWLLRRVTGPGQGMKVKTAPKFVPGSTGTAAELVAEFDALQDEQMELVRDADGLPIHRIRVTSPFEARVKYNAFAALSILPNHQHRHLEQAERAWAAAAGASG
jgi:hypothetical protein